jgi:antitoxin HicB
MTHDTIWLDVTEADTTAALHYPIVIEWSAEDDAFVVSVPGFPEIHTHGATREEAATMANEVIALTLAAFRQTGRVVPLPTFSALYHTGSDGNVAPARRTA